MPNTTSRLETLIRNGANGQVDKLVTEATIRLNAEVATLKREVESAKLQKQAEVAAATTDSQLADNSVENMVFPAGATGAQVAEQILNSMDYQASKAAKVVEVTQKWDAEIAKLQARAAAFEAKVQTLLS